MSRRRFLTVAGAAVGWGAAVELARANGLPGSLLPPVAPREYPAYRAETASGWHKLAGPVLGRGLGSCFDVCVLRSGEGFRMWFSWRPQKGIGHAVSADGIHWSHPTLVLSPQASSNWQGSVNRPCVVRARDGFHMWFTGQTDSSSAIGYAWSADGLRWTQRRDPVLTAEQPWEKQTVMTPSVLWRPNIGRFGLWYSAGDQYEPNAIGYAESQDGIAWSRPLDGPCFSPAGGSAWDRNRVTAPQVIPLGDEFLMFYIGFYNEASAEIGMARSRNGVTGWERSPANPIVRPGRTGAEWDYDAVYRPWAVRTGHGWMLWYNGRRGSEEEIGLAYHPGSRIWA